ncbi:MAG: DUF1800 domain-containing protein [Gemmatimonadaceae bacterium]|nr:DUF1800 domain-containing protein [Gemmatimonadaceae bacterium]
MRERDTETPQRPASRRDFLRIGAGAVASTAVASAVATAVAPSIANAQPPRGGSRTSPLPPTSSGVQDASKQWKDPLLRLVRRITMGLEPSEVALARQLGYNGYLNYHLRPSAIDDSALETTIATRLPMMAMDAATLRTQDQNEVINQISDAAWYRAAFSKAQLRERMVEFWTDHFNVNIDTVGFLKLVDDRDVIRPHALGNFATLLKASAHSGAMLRYLDQNTSRTPTPNQNYAREIMELHTLGADGGYSQNDVAELSRILTGWSMDNNGAFRYIRSYHDRNAKTFLGRTYPAMATTATDAQMKAEGDTAIDQLLAHPSTARYVSFRMARWLLAHEPSAAVVEATAAAFTRTGGDIATMVRTILSSKNLMAAPAKYKRPFHLSISGIRALGSDTTTVPNIRAVRQQADRMGQMLFRWGQPDGFPDTISWWSGLVITRWSYAQYLSSLNSTTVMRVDTTKFRTPDNADGVMAQIDARLFSGEMPVSLRTSLNTYLRGGTYNDARVREVLSLAMSAQEFQWY